MIKKYTILILIMSISFYLIGELKGNHHNPLLEEIKNTNNKVRIEPINAMIKENSIIPGRKGKEIDVFKTYQAMKEYGTYNESLIVWKEINPQISINNNYDEYIEQGNEVKRSIVLIFIIDKKEKLNDYLSILNQKNTIANFFIKETLLKELEPIIRKNQNQFFQLLYENSYKKESINYLELISKQKTNFCYTEKENEELIKNCSKYHLHTIKPSLIIKNNLLQTLKNNLLNSNIYQIELNSTNLIELSSSIEYIKNKGYKIVSLEELIKE